MLSNYHRVSLHKLLGRVGSGESDRSNRKEIQVSGWVGFDLDGTLAEYHGWKGVNDIGDPVLPMVDLATSYIESGVEIRIFTARVAGHGLPIIGGGFCDAITPIQEWCKKHLGTVVPVTNVKDFGMTRLYDDRAIQVQMNTGRIISPVPSNYDSVKNHGS